MNFSRHNNNNNIRFQRKAKSKDKNINKRSVSTIYSRITLKKSPKQLLPSVWTIQRYWLLSFTLVLTCVPSSIFVFHHHLVRNEDIILDHGIQTTNRVSLGLCIASSEPERTGTSYDRKLSHFWEYRIPSVHRDGAAVKLTFREHQVKHHGEA